MDNKILKKYIPGTIGGPKNPLRKQPGVYCIEHVETGMVYVGSTTSLSDRASKNKSALKMDKHKNKPLQKLYNDNPNIEIYVEPTPDIKTAQIAEQLVVNALKDTGKLCNVATTNVLKTKTGMKLTDEHKTALLKSSLGVKRSDESRAKMSKAHLGIPLDDEVKQKLSLVHLERLATPEGKAAHAKGIEKLMHSVMCNGVVYESKSAAARALGVDITTILHRCKSPNYPNFYEI